MSKELKNFKFLDIRIYFKEYQILTSKELKNI